VVGEEDCWPLTTVDDAASEPSGMPDASLLVALDGHIENAAELAAELSVRAGDLPGLVRACLAAWGEDFVGRLQGAFALVMVEPALGLVRLARDPLGVRPLYWARAGVGTLAFASLPCALTAVPGIGFEPDLQALRRELLGMPIISPATCYREIAMVPRGTLLRFEQLQPRSRPYWAPHAPSAVDEAEWVERYRRAFRRSTEGKLQGAPRPVGVTLSGGIDSSCVLGMARSGDGSVGARRCHCLVDRSCGWRRALRRGGRTVLRGPSAPLRAGRRRSAGKRSPARRGPLRGRASRLDPRSRLGGTCLGLPRLAHWVRG
jgi:asparagine synthetase B (glutamine-hydrolysing)